MKEAISEPYPWYPALNLGWIPFHTGAGEWGAQAPITAPAAPSTTVSVAVTTAAEFSQAALVPGTEITVNADILENIAVFGSLADVDIIVPEGRTLGQVFVGSYNPPSTSERVRIRGTTPGTHSGGLIGHLVFLSNPLSDIIIDGVDLNGADGEGGNLLWYFSGPVERAAIVNVRGHGVGAGALQHGTDIVIAGSSLMTGARPREVNGYPEGWGIRGGERVVVFGNRIDGTRYHRVRVHPGMGTSPLAWIANNVFVDPYEARIASPFALGGGNAKIAGFWAVCNLVYAHTTCLTPSFDGQDATYAQVTHNSIFGSLTSELHQVFETAHGPGRDYHTGNTYAPWEEPPAWGAPGDPIDAIPLPPVDPSKFDASIAGPDCPGP